jgi:hypothetical protein
LCTNVVKYTILKLEKNSFLTDSQISFYSYLMVFLQIPICPFAGVSFFPYRFPSVLFHIIVFLQIPKVLFQVSKSVLTDSHMSFPGHLILFLQIPKCPFPGISWYSYRCPYVLLLVSHSFLTDSQMSSPGISLYSYRFPMSFSRFLTFLTDSQVSFSTSLYSCRFPKSFSRYLNLL